MENEKTIDHTPIKVNVLGTEYTVEYRGKDEDKMLGTSCDGYCDHTAQLIVVCSADEDWDLADTTMYQKQVLRHELIHAFMFESGLGGSWEHKQFGQEETTVDWMARLFPKMLAAFQQANAL